MIAFFLGNNPNEDKPNWLHFFLFFVLFFTNQMSFRGSEFAIGGTIDIQVIIRLAVLGGIFALCMPYYGRFINLSRQIVLFVHVLLLVYLLAISSAPENMNFYSHYALATHFAMFFVMVVMVRQYGVENVIYYYFLSAAIFAVISLFYYYLIPEVGRYIYWQDGVLFQSTRLKGIGGHPNVMGFMLAVAMLAFVHLYLKGYPIGKIAYPALMLIVFCLVLTNSRTSLGGAILMILTYISIHFRLFIAMFIVGGMAIGFFVMAAMLSWSGVDEVMQIISRSGKVEEVTSLTGRSSIWNQIFDLIAQKPIFGWGHAVMGKVLTAHADQIGFSVGQAHNLYLQVLFAGGFVGLFLFLLGHLAAFIPSIIKTVNTRHAFEFCTIFYIILSGMTEAFMISSVATNAYLVFTLCLSSLAVYGDRQRTERV